MYVALIISSEEITEDLKKFKQALKHNLAIKHGYADTPEEAWGESFNKRVDRAVSLALTELFETGKSNFLERAMVNRLYEKIAELYIDYGDVVAVKYIKNYLILEVEITGVKNQ